MGRIILLPSLPAGIGLDVISQTPRGFVVQASDSELETLRSRGVPIAELYASGNDYVAALHGKSADEAMATLTAHHDTVIAALDPAERDQFRVA
jgi:hypothetical protein